MPGFPVFLLAAFLGQGQEGADKVGLDSLFSPETEYAFRVEKIDSAFLKKVARKTRLDLAALVNPGAAFNPGAVHASGAVSPGTRLICAGTRGGYAFIALELDGKGENSTFIAFNGEKVMVWLNFSGRPGCPEELRSAVTTMVNAF